MNSIYDADNLKAGYVPVVYGYYDRANMMESTPEVINHSHSLCEIMYVNEGTMSIETECGFCRVSGNQFIWIDAGVRHWDLRFNNSLCSMMNIEYQYEEAPGLAPDLGRLVAESAKLGEMFEQKPRVLTLTDRNGIIFQLLKSIIPLADSTSEQSRHLCSVLCTQVMLEIARLRGLNQTMEASANHLFREYTSRTMKDHLQRIRIQHAQELLSESHKSIQEIAAEVGFSSAQQLQQMFRRVVGVRPNDYRKQQQE